MRSRLGACCDVPIVLALLMMQRWSGQSLVVALVQRRWVRDGQFRHGNQEKREKMVVEFRNAAGCCMFAPRVRRDQALRVNRLTPARLVPDPIQISPLPPHQRREYAATSVEQRGMGDNQASIHMLHTEYGLCGVASNGTIWTMSRYKYVKCYAHRETISILLPGNPS